MIRRQATAAAMTLLVAAGGSACGGLFCQNTPVDQAAERIKFCFARAQRRHLLPRDPPVEVVRSPKDAPTRHRAPGLRTGGPI